MPIFAHLLANLIISAIAAYAAWMIGADPRETAINFFVGCCLADIVVAIITAD